MRALAILCLFAAACSSRSGTLVLVSVDSTQALSDVARLHVHATAGGKSSDFDVTLSPTTLPPKHTFGLDVPGSYHGALTAHIDAVASNGDTVASGDGMATLAPGSVVNLDITFGAGGSSDGGNDLSANAGDGAMPGDGAVGPSGDLGGIVITPAMASLGVGRSMRFSAPIAVTWSVMGGAASGTIDASGVYTAPMTPGTYFVLADATGAAGAATVEVKPLVMDVVGGMLGGPGNVDGVGMGAHFDNPEGVAYDHKGFAYVADTYNSTIRRINVGTGIVTTLAGSPAKTGWVDGVGAAARFNKPQALTVDWNGTTVWVADTLNNAIRQIDIASGTVTTILSDGDMGTAPVPSPVDISWANTDLYIAAGNSVVQLTLPSTVTVLSDNTHFTNLQGLFANFQSAGGLQGIYAIDGHGIKSVSTSDGSVTLLAGDVATNGSVDNATGTLARFKNPSGLAVGESGNSLYIVDTGNCTVRKMDLGGSNAVTTPFGTAMSCGYADGNGSIARFLLPRHIAFTYPDYYAVVADQNFSIRQLVVNGALPVTTVAGSGWHVGDVDGPSGTGELNFPLGVAFYQGKIYTADPGEKQPSHTIRRIDLATGAVDLFAGSPGITGTTNAAGMAARFNLPSDIVADGKGNLFVADRNNHAIRQIEIVGANVTTLAGTSGTSGYADLPGTSALFNHPSGLAVDGDTLWVADSGNALIRKVSISTGSVSTVAGTLGMPGANDDVGTMATVSFGGFVQGMTVDLQHNLYFSGGASIRKMDTTTTITTLAGSKTMAGLQDGIGDQALFGGVNDIAFDGFHTLFISDSDAVRQLDLNTLQVTTLLGSTTQKGVKPGTLPTTVNYAAGIDMTDTGDVLFTDFFENVVLRLRTQ